MRPEVKRNEKIRIAFFTDSFLPFTCGVTTATLLLAEGLAKKGHDVHVVAPRYTKNDPVRYGDVKVKRTLAIPSMVYDSMRVAFVPDPSVLRYVQANKINMIHLQTQTPLGIEAIVISKILKVPLVGTFHTFISDAEYLRHAGLDPRIFQKLAWDYCRFIYNKCDVVTSPAVSTAIELKRHGFSKPIQVISNGIELKKFSTKQDPSFISAHGSKVIVFVGRMAYEKSVDVLLKAFKIISKKVPEARLMLIGDGPQTEEIKALITELGLENKVTMKGIIPHGKLLESKILPSCRLFMTASKTENQPMTVMEAQASGLVCIGVNARGVPDLIIHNKNGLICPPDNAEALARSAISLLNDDRKLEKMRKNTIEMIKKHDSASIIDQWEDLYRKLMVNRWRN